MMKKSADEKVQQLLDEIMLINSDQYEILQDLRKIVFEAHPNVTEKLMYGGIMFSLSEPFGGIFASKNHVSFEFGQGFTMKDPQHKLEGTGKFRRHLKIKTVDDIQDKNVTFFVKQVG